MVNIHAFLDIFAVRVSALAMGRHKFFSESIASPLLRAQLSHITLEIPRIEGRGTYEVVADTPVGTLHPAFLVTHWLGEDHATILYHHGNGERPFDLRWFSPNTFKNIFLSASEPIQANVVALVAPFHRLAITDYMKKLGQLSNFVVMLSVSVTLVDRLVSYFKQCNGTPVMVTGISLGGWVTNIHRAFYNTADLYVPLLAGAALGDIFSASIYRTMTGRLARQNPDILKRVLDFEEDFKQVGGDNVYPLLARYDQIVQYERQSVSYGERPIKTLEKGHITAAQARNDLREHILRHLEVPKR